MKRLCLIMMLAVSALLLKGQGTAPVNIINYKALENKLSKSNEAILNTKKNIDPKTWLSRGDLFLEAYNINLQYLRRGMSANEVKIMFGQPNQVQNRTEGQKTLEEYIYDRVTIVLDAGLVDSWEETKKIHENPLPEAFKAYEKAFELDVANKLSDKIKEGFVKLKLFYENEGIISYNNKSYQEAYSNFNNILKINELPIMAGVIDTMVFYSAGRAAKESGNLETAVQLFNKTLELNYNDPFVYIFLNECYRDMGDTVMSLETLQKGFKKNPENQPILIELINFYLIRGESEAALEYLSLARREDPQNTSFIFAEGTIFDKLGRSDEAIEAYKACLEIDPQYFNAQFNLSVVYYNRAVKIIEEAQEIKDDAIYEQKMKDAETEFQNAVPYMESAKENSPEENKCEVLGTLKTLYYRVKLEDKRQAAIEEMTMLGCQ